MLRSKKVRIEIHLESKEVKELDKIAKKEGRSRKNLCETEIRKLINDAQRSARLAKAGNKCSSAQFTY